jgi:TetR/AcrR family transcriptional regulator, transcriptional repressor for nem operon
MATRRRTSSPDTAAHILDVAERLVQRRGFNGFSYADVAAELQISKAALHYHFASKAELGEALLARYASRFAAALDALDALDAAGAGAPAKLDGYVKLYLDVLRNERMCLCGMLAAEYQTLPMPMRGAVVDFFDYNETWLTKVLDEGRDEGTLEFEGPTGDRARMIVGGLEGAMLVARPYGDIARFEVAATQLVQQLEAPAPSVGRKPDRLAAARQRRGAG